MPIWTPDEPPLLPPRDHDARPSPESAGGTDAAETTAPDAEETPRWWAAAPASPQEPPTPTRLPLFRRRLVRRLTAGAGAVAIVGALSATVLPTALRAAAPTITTVPVSAAQQAVGAPAVSVFKAVSPSIVLVTNQSNVQSYYGTQQQTDWGSGMVLTPSGYIVTNAHVVAGATSVTVTLSNGKNYPATVVGADTSTDIAVIKLSPPSALQPVTWANSHDVSPGEVAVAIGNPLGPEFAQSVTVGVVSAIRPMLYGGSSSGGVADRVTEMIQTDAPINPGNSGGALANAQGEVIGMTSMEVAGTTGSGAPTVGLGFAIPSNTVIQVVNDLIRLGYVPRAWLGVAIDATPANALPSQPQTLTLASVDSGGAADKAGLQVGDVLTSWNGQKITNYWQLVGDINAAAPGQTVTLGYTRNGAGHTATVTLGTEPKSMEQPAPASAPTPQQASPYPFPFPFPFPNAPGGGSGGGY